MYHSIDIKSCELHIDITKEGETGAKQLSNITQKYLNIYVDYGSIYKSAKLNFEPLDFIPLLVEIHNDKDYIKNYFK